MHRLTALATFAGLLMTQAAFAIDHTKDSLETVRKNVDQKKAVIVDVRDESEWNAGHLDGATLLPYSQIRKNVDAEAVKRKLPKGKIIYTHCKAGVRSLGSAIILEKLGYDVRPLEPGYDKLIEAGFPKAK